MLNHFFGLEVEATNKQRQPAERNNISMGNYRFKLSDMIPNSWFYKLKDMGIKRRNQKKEPSSTSPTQLQPVLLHSHPRKSHHFTRELAACRDSGNSPAEPPRKSSKGKQRRRGAAAAAAAARSSPRLMVTSSSGCSCGRAALESVSAGPPLPPELRRDPPLLTEYSFYADDDANAIIFEKGHKSLAKKTNGSDEELKSLAQIDLPPIITRSPSSSSKPEETDAADGSTCPSATITKKDKSFAREPRSSPSRRFPVNSPGPKFRIMNSPRVSSKRFGHLGRRKGGSSSSAAKRSLTDSLAIVKSTNDPQKDFRDSMVEMIVENKISASNELEDLLACYLSLNTDEYHDIIIKVFKQIWFDMTDIGV